MIVFQGILLYSGTTHGQWRTWYQVMGSYVLRSKSVQHPVVPELATYFFLNEGHAVLLHCPIYPILLQDLPALSYISTISYKH